VVEPALAGHPASLLAGHLDQRAADGEARDAARGARPVQLGGEAVLDRAGRSRPGSGSASDQRGQDEGEHGEQGGDETARGVT
jgi:hypothetical protein